VKRKEAVGTSFRKMQNVWICKVETTVVSNGHPANRVVTSFVNGKRHKGIREVNQLPV